MNKKTNFITGLKALGALMVVISHLKMQFSGYSDLSWKFVTFAADFIVLFICISAFTVSMSIEKRIHFQLIPYMKRRWLRLAPSYYVVLVIGFLIKIFINGWKFIPANWQNLLYDFFFLNLDPLNIKSQAAILGVEWMLPIMFWFYLLIPLFLYSVRKIYPLFIVFFLLAIYLHFNPNILITYKGFGGPGWSLQFYIVIYIYTIFIYFLHTRSFELTRIRKNWVYFSFSGLLTSICFLMLLYYMKSSSERVYVIGLLAITGYLLWIKKWLMDRLDHLSRALFLIVDNLDIIFLSLVLYKYMLNFYFIKYPHIILSFWFGALLLAGFHRPLLSRIVFENRIVLFLGTISFGIYLVHPIAITIAERTIPMQYPWLRVMLIFPLAIVGAYILYRKVEMPTRNRV